jgi:cell division protease FtsH
MAARGVPGREAGERLALLRDIGIGVGLALAVYLLTRGVNLLPLLLMVGLGYFLVRAMGGLPGVRPRFASVVTSRAVPPTITFDDVGGQSAAKQELLEALDFLGQMDKVRRLGIRPLKGLLLTGPPGTGKTLLAKAAANYTGSVFIAASGSEFIEVYAGVGAQRVRELFRRAREEGRQHNGSAIVFIDEIEVLGGKRGRHTSHLEYDQTLNQLLVEMDGIHADDPVRVLVVGATNRADLLDEALLRPGRFDRIVKVDLPDREGRRQILDLHTRGKPLAPGVDLDKIARETFGFSGAHLESLANEAAILAMREGLEEIPERCFLEAIDKVIMGEKLDRRPSEEERRRIAVHEAGHALVGELTQPGSVARVVITSRGQALGYVRQAPRDDLYLYTREYLEREIQGLLAGSVAEEIVLGSRSTGASNDFERVMQLVNTMIASGMSSQGVVDLEHLPAGMRHRLQSEIVHEQEEVVRALLRQHLPVLEEMARVLVEEESLSGDQLRAWLGSRTAADRAAAAS